jgi:N-acetylglucosaminyldiphosphoundecaprenol N-acetyl-beta-D-mannosaminyltransferase
MPQPAEFRIAGVKINALRNVDLVEIVDDWIRSGKREYVVLTGAHGVVEMQGDPELKEINNRAALVTPDGMPVVWVGKLKGHRNIEKVYAPTIMDALYSAGVAKHHGHFLYGGAEGVADLLKSKLEAAYPGIRIVGTHCPPFRPLRPEEVRAVADTINTAKPEIVWVGLGCPKQERWMHQFRPLLNAPVLIGVGAGFDFLAGRAPLAPKWIQNSGFEWLFRIFFEPRRLLRRYSRVVPLFLYYAAREFLFPSRAGDSPDAGR